MNKSKTSILQSGTIKYAFREVEKNKGTEEFVIPHSDSTYENDFGYVFDSPEDAMQFLKDSIASGEVELEESQHWFLVQICTSVFCHVKDRTHISESKGKEPLLFIK